jgi:P-type conjugative transfer protein TrbG
MQKKTIAMTITGLFLVNLQGCRSIQSNALTHVPQEPIWQAQLHPIVKKKRCKTSVSPSCVRAKYLSTQPPEIQRAFLQYQDTGKAPVIQANDFLQLPYSESEQPIITCQPLKVCDIALEMGEVITSVKGGDTARWIFDEMYSGDCDSRQPHVLVKPKFADISSDMVIATTKRTYHIGLLSKPDHYIRQAKFYYPDEMIKQLNALHARMEAELKQKETMIVASVPSIDPDRLDFHYHISAYGNPAWQPLHAFNDGTHVFIEMPLQLRVTNAPVLFIQTRSGEKELVNYRIKKNYYIVDELFKQAILVSGLGCEQENVTITYTG